MKTIVAALLLGIGLAGCGKEPPEGGGNAPGDAAGSSSAGSTQGRPAGVGREPAARPASPSGSPSSRGTGPHSPSAKIVVRNIIVQQEVTSRGISANVTRIGPDNQSSFFTSTDDNGVAAPNQPCAPNDRFDVEPAVPAYLRIPPKMCAETLTFELPSAQATRALIVLGNDALKANDYGKAQVYFLAAANRLALSDAARAAELRAQANAAAGKSLGVSAPGESVKGSVSAATKLRERLRDFQSSRNLPPTGVLDRSTAQRLGGLDETSAVRHALEVPRERLKGVGTPLLAVPPKDKP